jgi:hypothetical protein
MLRFATINTMAPHEGLPVVLCPPVGDELDKSFLSENIQGYYTTLDRGVKGKIDLFGKNCGLLAF